jgi:hypothetical protein
MLVDLVVDIRCMEVDSWGIYIEGYYW